MPSQMPTTDTINRTVKDFGIGTYDSPVQSEYNDEGEFETTGESLPIKRDPRNDGDEIVGDSYCPTSEVTKTGAAELPGDFDRAPRRTKKPEDSTIQTPVESVAQSQLPNDKNNPPARSDYYDRTKIGDTMLPGTPKNDQSLDMFLGALGNWFSGWTDSDVAQPLSFPTMDSPAEETDKYTSVPMGTASVRKTRSFTMKRQATNLDLVGTLASDFLKKNGKKGMTRRHVMAFLRDGGFHQYLASDVVRCLEQRHGVYIADVLDQFPASTKKVASVDVKTAAARHLVEIGKGVALLSSSDPHASNVLKKCGDDIMRNVVELVRGLEDG